ncbi:MAG: glycosyltransferase, partial [bacterium]
VGQYVPEEFRARKGERVLIDNLTEDDEEGIRNAYYEASVFVSPLKGPGGTRLKHFAAMAAKLPLVTTKVGAEGLGVVDDEHILVRDNPEALAEAAVEILTDPIKAKSLADNARKLVEEKYSWFKMSEYLDKIYKRTANGK